VTDDRELLKGSLAAPRIGLVVSYLPIDNKKSHLFVVAGFIEAIACAYKNFSVMLLIANDDQNLIKQGRAGTWKRKYTNKNYTAALTKLIIEILGSEIAENVTVKVVNDASARIHKSIKLINGYNPHILFFWGGLYACKVLQRVMYKRYPIGFCFFNIKNPVDENADIYITRNIDQQVTGPHDPTKCVYQPVVFKPRENEYSYPVDYVKKSTDELTITTVISGERLAEAFRSYTKARLDSFFTIFSRHKNVRWVFVGPNTPSKILLCDPRFSQLRDQNRIEIIKKEHQLCAFLRHCDLYVHLPDIVGGGGGVNMARSESVATLCFIGSDACGAQIPEAIYSEDKDFFSAISFYIENQDERIALGKKVREYVITNNSSEAVSAKMRNSISTALANYWARQSFASNELSLPKE